MEGSRKLKITFSVGLVLVLVIVGVVFSILNNRVKPVVEQDVLGQTNIAVAPYIISLPPVVAYAGEKYTYDIKYSDSDSESADISVSLENAPVWLNIEGLHISGTPPVGTSGQYKFDVKISDGVNSSVQENYILIQDNEAK
ncbi:MAG: hypothetical protein UR96_C0035G0004 [candidate division WS6 bacterium GW2011_GWC1_36_11]|uniref:Dystroglycan-type cadherin-like domain-containing protein n=3 Tax=Candidatus Dojkabacteria TaxID=74243 RepID=A0A0G0D9N0_9BACT|nr:MAG: hypothetical protein UR96_C0035G0004 [candidate division WS6 bacterium GW2011_GWC1_36_11]KKQ03939.1 MAG: hypothetical protein US14_C0029G0004 [candidate division WS6 bacterium GW2011_WS6_36_26]KKQ11032.1 MAG: hypothetical protein US23_C0013G0004 [candidate division WS6 bacterium GW2011_GWE1_36_69]KKQ11531.1 MAG: hypothetical protein US24_C0024G0011 [candidate division WS6 bacterium GW2011_GWC2_36_7]KKQ17829.1 MAG: hypothetical protein US29_C0005G0016 [candidate division WS6 bacterium GW